jgi:PhnB protein
MASDIVPSFGQNLNVGNNNYVSIFPDSKKKRIGFSKAFLKAEILKCLLKTSFGATILEAFRINMVFIGW